MTGDKTLPGIAAEDMRKAAYGVFKKGRGFIGQTFGIAGEHLTGANGRGAHPRHAAVQIFARRVCDTDRCAFTCCTRIIPSPAQISEPTPDCG